MERVACRNVLTWSRTDFQPSPPLLPARVSLIQTIHLVSTGCEKQEKEVAEAKCPLLCFFFSSQSQNTGKAVTAASLYYCSPLPLSCTLQSVLLLLLLFGFSYLPKSDPMRGCFQLSDAWIKYRPANPRSRSCVGWRRCCPAFRDLWSG